MKENYKLPGVYQNIHKEIPWEVLETEMSLAVKRNIILPEGGPEKYPNLVVLCGPCRTATGAVATALIKSENVTASHIQPLKTSRRNVLSQRVSGQSINYERLQLLLAPGDHTEVIKETLGPRTQAEFFDPIKPLLEKGYPPEKITLMPSLREPLDTIDSTIKMWSRDLIDIELFNYAYLLTAETVLRAQENGINVIPYVHELIRDHGASDVMARTLALTGISYNEGVVTWNGHGYESTTTYEVPPSKFTSGSVSKANGGRGGLRWRPPTMVLTKDEQLDILPKIRPSYDVYQQILKNARVRLKL